MPSYLQQKGARRRMTGKLDKAQASWAPGRVALHTYLDADGVTGLAIALEALQGDLETVPTFSELDAGAFASLWARVEEACQAAERLLGL